MKRGLRFIRGGEVELSEKLGRNDRCPCGSRRRFQELLPPFRPVSTGRKGATIGVDPDVRSGGTRLR
ncbi:MAG: SEC-C domain-containing protein [Novosphingobium sp.]|nr:SEC-C domain-containing protein [Novosphingobium sp.]